jgi:hypothetical protein
MDDVHWELHAVTSGVSDMLCIKLNFVFQLGDKLFHLLVAVAKLFVRNLVLLQNVLDGLRLVLESGSDEDDSGNFRQ